MLLIALIVMAIIVGVFAIKTKKSKEVESQKLEHAETWDIHNELAKTLVELQELKESTITEEVVEEKPKAKKKSATKKKTAKTTATKRKKKSTNI